jgi:hypothetical protein
MSPPQPSVDPLFEDQLLLKLDGAVGTEGRVPKGRNGNAEGREQAVALAAASRPLLPCDQSARQTRTFRPGSPEPDTAAHCLISSAVCR